MKNTKYKGVPIWMLTVDINAQKGTKVKVVVNEQGEVWNGFGHHKETVKKYLEKDKIYTIEKIDDYNSNTNVYLKEIEDVFQSGQRVYFNSTNLVEIDKIKKWERYNK